MKTNRKQVIASLVLMASVTVLLEKPLHGPKGGKIVTVEAPHVEFFVEEDRTVSVSFYDADLRPVLPTGQVVTAIAETSAAKVRLAFAAKEGSLVSAAPLPEGDGYIIVVQVRDTSESRPKNYRVRFHDEVCGECKRAEYACICHDEGEGQDEHED